MVLMPTGRVLDERFQSFTCKINGLGLCAYLELFNLTP